MTQPIIPVPTSYSEIELAYIEEEPPGLWPSNQDSNFGIHRKVFCDELTIVADQLDVILSEFFISTSTEFLANHEDELGLPINPAGRTLEERRGIALSRMKRGPFTHSLIASIVKSYISVTFGPSIIFNTLGVPIGSGIPLFSPTGDVSQLFRVYFDIQNFTYEVRISADAAIDTESLTRELDRITPSAITYSIVSTESIIDYYKTVRSFQPNALYHLDTNASSSTPDSSGFGHDATLFGSPPVTVSPSLVSTEAGGIQAMTFNGVDQYMEIPDSPELILGSEGNRFTIDFWISLEGYPASGQTATIFHKTGAYHIYIDEHGTIFIDDSAGTQVAKTNISLGLNTTYFVSIRKKSSTLSIKLNDIEHGTILVSDFPSFTFSSNPIFVASYDGTTGFLNTILDEISIYDSFLTDAQQTELYKTGNNIA